jgi:hypothetical protein
MSVRRLTVAAALGLLPVVSALNLGADEPIRVIRLEAASPGRVFGGIGVVSAAAFNPATWHHPRPEMNGARIMGLVDGRKLTAINDGSRAKGMAFLASTYDHNLFDNARVGPLQTEAKSNALNPG